MRKRERPERPVRDRFIASLLAGGIVAGLVTYWADSAFHRSLAASAARSAAHGHHQTVGGLLFSGFVAVTIVVATVLFIVATARARHRQARLDAQLQAAAGRVPRRPRGRGAVTGHGGRYTVQDGRQRHTGGHGPAV